MKGRIEGSLTEPKRAEHTVQRLVCNLALSYLKDHNVETELLQQLIAQIEEKLIVGKQTTKLSNNLFTRAKHRKEKVKTQREGD